jgi:uncharacterized protein with PIN domain
MSDEKDRFGDKLRDAERAREDKYFAERDRDLVEKMREQKAGTEETGARVGSHMRCPKCGELLTSTSHLDVTVEQCTHCGGVWLDKGELAELARREKAGWLARYLGRGR